MGGNPIPKGYDAAMVRRAREMRGEAMSVAEIARATGYSLAWVKKAVRGEPVPPALRRRYAKDAEREKALAMREAGVHPRAIADEVGVSVSTVYQWTAPGAPRSKPSRGTAAVARDPGADDRLMPAVVELRRAGMSVEATAAHLHVGAARVRRILSRPDIPAELVGLRPKVAQRDAARALRLEGASVPDIARQLDVARSTAFRWTQDLPVPEPFRDGAMSVRNRAAINDYWASELARRESERAAEVRAAFSEVGPLTERELMLVGAALYWAEGTKSKPWRRSEKVTFINSDPSMIRLFMRWLSINHVDPTQVRLAVQIHERADVAAAVQFWAGVTGVPAYRFAKTTLKRHNPKTVRKNVDNDQYHGCLTIGVRQSRALYRRIQGLWDGVVVAATQRTQKP